MKGHATCYPKKGKFDLIHRGELFFRVVGGNLIFCGKFRGRTTSALWRTWAHIGAHERTVKKCTFWFGMLVAICQFHALMPAINLKFCQLCYRQTQHAFISSAFDDSKLSTMIHRLHSTNTLVEGMSKVAFGDSSASRKRELEVKIAEPCLTRRFFLVGLSMVPLPLIPFLFAYQNQEPKARLEKLRRKGSNQAGFEKPGELPVPGFLTARTCKICLTCYHHVC